MLGAKVDRVLSEAGRCGGVGRGGESDSRPPDPIQMDHVLVRPSITLCCSASSKTRRSKQLFAAADEDMMVLLEMVSLDDASQSDGDTESNRISSFLGRKEEPRDLLYSFFANSVSPLAESFSQKLLPSVVESLCRTLDYFEEEERNAVYDLFLASSIPEVSTKLRQRIQERACDKKTVHNEVCFGTTSTNAGDADRFATKDTQAVALVLKNLVMDIFQVTSKGFLPMLSLNRSGVVQADNDAAAKQANSIFLGRTSEAQNLFFCRFLKIVQIVLNLLKYGKVSTKRDIFYTDVRLFVKQGTSDSMLELLARELRVPRFNLNVVSCSRSLVFGALRFHNVDGTVLECDKAAITMPSTTHSQGLECYADAVFVIEISSMPSVQ